MFQLINTEGYARRGQINIADHKLDTPVFVSDAIYLNESSMTAVELQSQGSQFAMLDAMRLWTRYGDKVKQPAVVKKLIPWDGLLLSQLAAPHRLNHYSVKLSKQGVCFHSQLGGERLQLSPDDFISIQHQLGADIVMTYAHPQGLADPRTAVDTTLHWAQHCQHFHGDNTAALFAVVPTFADADLQQQLCHRLMAMDFSGYMFDSLLENIKQVPVPICRSVRYVTTVAQMVKSVEMGVDIIHSSMPMQRANKGQLLTASEEIDIFDVQYRDNFNSPVDSDCDCTTCKHFSRAYLHYLYTHNIMLARRLGAIHNQFFCQRLMFYLRTAIERGNMLSKGKANIKG